MSDISKCTFLHSYFLFVYHSIFESMVVHGVPNKVRMLKKRH